MNINIFTKKNAAVVVASTTAEPKSVLRPAMPEVGSDPVDTYCLAIEENAPFEEHTLSFSNTSIQLVKKVLPSDFSLAGNESKAHSFKIPTIDLSAKQADALRDRIKDQLVPLPMRFNKKHREDSKLPEYLPSEQVHLVDYVLFQKVSEMRFSPTMPEIIRNEPKQLNENIAQEVEKRLYEIQGFVGKEKPEKKKS